MRALVYIAPEKLEIQDVPAPQAGAGEVSVSVQMAGICGSDLSGYLGHSARRKPPLVLGHELVGRLPDGRRVVANPLVSCNLCDRCLAGQQNLCRSWRLLGMDRTQGTYADAVVVPETQVLPIPDDMPALRAILTEPLANIVHLYRIAEAAPFANLAIVGAGTMGSLALAVGRLLGHRNILIADINQERLAVMPRLGAQLTVNVSAPRGQDQITEAAASGYDLVVDASGTTATRQLALRICRAGGRVVFLGMGSERSEIEFVPSIRKEHRIIMSFAYTPLDFRRALELLVSNAVDLAPWTASLPLERGQEAFERMTRAPGATLKMVLTL